MVNNEGITKQGSIDQTGCLRIQRGDQQDCYVFCPYQKREDDTKIYCGDACALFGEPRSDGDGDGNKIWWLVLCQKTWHFREFIDHRVSKEAKK